MPRLRFPEAFPLVLALLITAFAGLLRLDAFVGKYGTLDHPAWARVLTHDVAPLGAHLRPSFIAWTREARPYVGGDPINYLQYGREMRSFYQAHVREPIFLAVTRGFLALLDDQDVAVSFASAAGSILAVLGIYLLGAELVSPIAGLAAALVLAGDFDVITWAPDGWRDDTFMAAVVFAAWAFLRFRRSATGRNAVLLGVTAAVVCLTRITALSFVLPALAWLVIIDCRGCPPAERRARAKMAAGALMVMTLLVAPYLISCWIATGDPLFAINYHTGYYRYGEGLPSEKPMSAAAYVGGKFAARPFAAFDTGAVGIFVQPFVTKWFGLEPWLTGLGSVLSWCAVLGLVLLPFSAAGRLLLVVLLTALLPYAFTWNIAGGGQWRFTMHVYPLYIVAAFYGIARVAQAVRDFRGRRSLGQVVPWRPAVAVIALAVLAVGGYFALPWFVVREAIAAGEDVSVDTGDRDLAFFGRGWSRPHRDGVLVRVSLADRAVVRFPLPEQRAYDVVLRLDPVAANVQRRVTLLLNRQLLGSVILGWNPERVGAYRLKLPAHQVRAGINELTIVPETLVTAAAAGPRFEWLGAQQRLGVRLWYLRVLGAPAR